MSKKVLVKDEPKPAKLKFAFSYSRLKPDLNSSLEYSFEELMAKEYLAMYEMEDAADKKYREMYQDKLDRLEQLERENQHLKEQLARGGSITSDAADQTTKWLPSSKQRTTILDDTNDCNFTSVSMLATTTTTTATAVTRKVSYAPSATGRSTIFEHSKENDETTGLHPMEEVSLNFEATKSMMKTFDGARGGISPNMMTVCNLDVSAGALAEMTNVSSTKTFTTNTAIKNIKKEFKQLFDSDKANDSNIERVDMDMIDEAGESEPDKFDFELTNFNPTGSSTRFGLTRMAPASNGLKSMIREEEADEVGERPEVKKTREEVILTSGDDDSNPTKPTAEYDREKNNDAASKESDEKIKSDMIFSSQNIMRTTREITRGNQSANNQSMTETVTRNFTATTTGRLCKTLEWDDGFNKFDDSNNSSKNNNNNENASRGEIPFDHQQSQLMTQKVPHMDDMTDVIGNLSWYNSNTTPDTATKNVIPSTQTLNELMPVDEQEEASSSSTSSRRPLTRVDLEASYHEAVHKLCYLSESLMNGLNNSTMNSDTKTDRLNQTKTKTTTGSITTTRSRIGALLDNTTKSTQAAAGSPDLTKSRIDTADLTKSRVADDLDDTASNDQNEESMYPDRTRNYTDMTTTRIDDTHMTTMMGGGGDNNNSDDAMSDTSNQTLSDDQDMTQATGRGRAALSETIVGAIHDPFDFEIRQRLLQRGPIDKLKSKANYAQFDAEGPRIVMKKNLRLKKGCDLFVLEDVDKGAFAKIYLVETEKKERVALKVDSKAVPWEFYITETLHERLNELLSSKRMRVNVMDSFVRMHEIVKFKNSCYATMPYFSRGNLLTLVNYHVTNNETFPYWFVLYLTLEMLCILKYLHDSRILHTDIKPDNMLINTLPNSLDYFDPSRTKCIVLIDFNRSIDLDLMPSEVEFQGSKHVNKSLLCNEMRQNKPWSYQVDYYGLLSCIFCVIHKSFMNVSFENGRYRTITRMPRHFDKLFTDMFDTFLNIPSSHEMPDLQTDWIDHFLVLFKTELAESFHRSKEYLRKLNKHYQ